MPSPKVKGILIFFVNKDRIKDLMSANLPSFEAGHHPLFERLCLHATRNVLVCGVKICEDLNHLGLIQLSVKYCFPLACHR